MQLNDEICMANEAVVVFNVETIQQNTQWIESGIDASEATAESNDILTSENESRVVACNAASRGFEQVPPAFVLNRISACLTRIATDCG
jgi:hypothetical protein